MVTQTKTQAAAKKAASSKRSTNKPADGTYSTLKFAVEGPIATITLNRPERLNAISDAMSGDIRLPVDVANADERVHGDTAAGGSDFATCCDVIVMEDKARMGYMPVRVWACRTRPCGCPAQPRTC